MDAAKQVAERREQSRTRPGPLTLFLLLSQPCRLARIWLSMAWTQSSRSSDVEASKSHVWPVRDTIMNSNGSSGSGKERCAMTWVREGGGLPASQGVSRQTDPSRPPLCPCTGRIAGSSGPRETGTGKCRRRVPAGRNQSSAPGHHSCCLHSSLRASSTSVGLLFLPHVNTRSLVPPSSQARKPRRV